MVELNGAAAVNVPRSNVPTPEENAWTRHKRRHIVLTSHPSRSGQRGLPIHWGEADPLKRGPIVATVSDPSQRNVIGTHSGSYAVYRALAVASGVLQPDHRPDLTNTAPAVAIGPHPSWADPSKIVSLDPFGAMVGEVYQPLLEQGIDIRPTIAITRAHIQMPELNEAVRQGRLVEDGQIMKPGRCRTRVVFIRRGPAPRGERRRPALCPV